MMLCRRIDSVTSCIAIFVLFGVASCYKRYFVEEDCKDGLLQIHVAPEGKGSAGILRVTRHLSYELRITCNIELSAPETHGIVASIRMVGLRTELDGSCEDFLKIFMQHSEKVLCQSLLDLDEAQSYATHNGSDTLRMLYKTAEDLDNTTTTHHPGFELSFTAYRRIRYFNESDLDPSYFECDNGRVIWSGLKCDGHNNCGDRSDEGSTERIYCDNSSSGSMPLIIAGILMVMLLFIACMATLVWSERKRTRILRKRIGSASPLLPAQNMGS